MRPSKVKNEISLAKLFLLNSIFIMALGVVFLPLSATAQTQQGSDPLQIEIDPKNPEPGQNVKVTAKSYSFDVSRAEVSYFINGELRTQDIGRTTYSFTIGDLGEKSNIQVVAEQQDGTISKAEKNIMPINIDMVWEAETYTPPFYKGKPLQAPRADVRVSVFPDFVRTNKTKIARENLYYKWQLNGNLLQNSTGRGNSSITLRDVSNIKNRDLTFRVEVSSADQTMSSFTYLTIPKTEPKIVFYHKHPLRGIRYHKPIQESFEMESQETTILGTPYFFSSEEKSSPKLEYQWGVDGEEQPGSEGAPYALTLRHVNEEGGKANVSLSVRHSENYLQTAENSFDISF